MLSKQKPYLRLVWPPAVLDEDNDDSSFTLPQALRSDGWRSVSVEDLRRLPPDSLVIMNGYMIDGQLTYWLKDAPQVSPFRP